MLPVALVSQSQALPLLLLPLAMAAAHPQPGRLHARQHLQTVSSTPMLYPARTVSCSLGRERAAGERYDIIIDPRLDLSGRDQVRAPD